RDNAGQSAPGGLTNGTGTPPALCNGGEIDRWAVGNGRGIRSVRLAGTGALRLQLLGPHVAGPLINSWAPRCRPSPRPGLQKNFNNLAIKRIPARSSAILPNSIPNWGLACGYNQMHGQ